MRPKFQAQREFEFPTSNLKLTQEYYAKYRAISKILDVLAQADHIRFARGTFRHGVALHRLLGELLCSSEGYATSYFPRNPGQIPKLSTQS